MSQESENIERIIRKSLRDHYGIEAQISRLTGENLNYLVNSDDGSKFVYKVVDDHMPPEVVELEMQALEHAKTHGFRPKLPGIVKNYTQNIETGIEIPSNPFNRARLIDFVDGTDLENIPDISSKMLKNIGKQVACFNLALKDFEHPVAHRSHRWDLAGADQHKKYISLIEDRTKAQLLTWAFEQWSSRAVPYFDDLPWQIIHGDLNQENLLMRGDEVAGVVDFGDMLYNPTVCDLAICLAYLMMGQEDPMGVAETLIAAYESERALTDVEREVLFPLVCGRLAVTILMAEQRKRIDPDNPTWFGSEGPAFNLLEQLAA